MEGYAENVEWIMCSCLSTADAPPSDLELKKLLCVSKILVKVASNGSFRSGEKVMQLMNEFIGQQQSRMKELAQTLVRRMIGSGRW